MTAHTDNNNHPLPAALWPGRPWQLRAARITRNDDGTFDVANLHQAGPGDRAAPAATARAPGTRLIGWAGWLLAILGGGILAVSYQGQFVSIFTARHQVIASNIEAGMFDIGMVIFALLGLGLAFAGKPAFVERVCVIACAAGSAVMNYAAADVASPRSVIAYLAPPLFLALVVDRVIAVVRRWKLGTDEGSPWAPAGRALLAVLRLAGVILLYTLRLILATRSTAKGLRQAVLDAAPLPALDEEPAKGKGRVHLVPDGQPGTKKAALLALYRGHPAYGDRAQASRVAAELAPAAGLQPGSARSYLYAYLDGAAS
jgi:hypothetical protein